MKFLEIIDQNKILKKNFKAKPTKIIILTNVTISPLKEILYFYLAKNNVNIDLQFGNYNNIIQDSLTIDSNKIVIIFWEFINIINDYNKFIKNNKSKTIEIHIKKEIDIISKNLKNNRQVFINDFSHQVFNEINIK